ncbi:MAG: GerMN domain-containing protein [Acidimicrobiales bacterium]
MTMAAKTPTRLAIIVIITGLLLSSCGVQKDSEPRALPSKDVPFGLLDNEVKPTSDTPSPERPLSTENQNASIFLVDNNERLYEVSQNVANPGGVRQVLLALFTDLNPEQLAKGLNTSIDAGTRLLDVVGPSPEGLVTIDVNSGLSTPVRKRLRLALAQIVYTATAVPDVSSVRFKIDGKLSEVLDGTGAATSKPLTRSDFADFAPL